MEYHAAVAGLAILAIEGQAEHVKVSIHPKEGFAFEEPDGIAPGEGGRGLQGERTCQTEWLLGRRRCYIQKYVGRLT